MRNYETGLIQTKLFIRWMKEDGHILNPAFSSEMIYIYELNRFRLFIRLDWTGWHNNNIISLSKHILWCSPIDCLSSSIFVFNEYHYDLCSTHRIVFGLNIVDHRMLDASIAYLRMQSVGSALQPLLIQKSELCVIIIAPTHRRIHPITVFFWHIISAKTQSVLTAQRKDDAALP